MVLWVQKMRNAESLPSWHLKTYRKNGNRKRKLTFIKHIPLIKIRDQEEGNMGRLHIIFDIKNRFLQFDVTQNFPEGQKKMERISGFLWLRPGKCHLIRIVLITLLVNTWFIHQGDFERDPGGQFIEFGHSHLQESRT